jgi:hypothetical protein
MFQRSRSLVDALPAPARCARALLALAVLACVVGGPARADERDEVFSVKDVMVDATSTTAAQAREQALAAGQREAFRRLLARLTLKRDQAKLPKPDATALVDLVQGYEVQEEKNSPVRYIATLTYQFKRRAVEALLRDAGVPFAETPSKPVVVLPVLRDGDSALLWDDPNPWRAAWANLPPSQGLVPFAVPLGDITDLADVTTQQAIDGDQEHLRAVAQRYGAGSTLVAVATLHKDADGNPTALDLALSRHGLGIVQPVAVESVAATAGEAPEALFARAARQAESEVTERWIEDNLLHFDQVQDAVASVPISGLEDWLKVRQRLDQVALVSRAELVSLTRSEAKVDVRYLGDAAQLKLALAQHDLLLTEEAGGLVLHLAGTAAATQ